ncbi:MAG: hypothetical protein K9W46_13360 [Candidatus Heimdallarchaeum endolithica]|uniref:Uncharacterized protein n=1 Tax=Candidatus Heimdallarchaeum endolithica TaxID=2876572 RepID=A0A9Y1FP62_9ARCH|nr:MAG: hypothetical protein K9W46_13360 [Candidatus Heimdallarchaeum endolithica]
MKLSKKKGVSPIVATILMFTLILAAIGVSLVYMFPSIIQFKDNSYNNSVRLYFSALDSNIQNLLVNPPPQAISFDYYQEDGSLYFDNSKVVYFTLYDTASSFSKSIIAENLTRLVHKSTNVEDFEEGEHRYLKGPEDQDYLFINGSTKLYNDITVINETRTIFDPAYLYMSLYYRYCIDIDYRVVGTEEIFTIDIIHVSINTNSDFGVENTTKSIPLEIEFSGTEKISLEPIAFNSDLIGKANIYGEHHSLEEEQAVYVPVNTNYSFHYLYVNIIKINININIVG